ncbi:MAG TPA: RNA 2',3'-cyclic phosphodiesterase [Solirubrobacteraceae bacterium]
MSARLFVALELPADARAALARWRSDVAASVPRLRLVQGEDLHVTLCFLGSRPEDEIEAIGAACAVVAGEPVADAAFGSALWLPARRPRVLAVALSDPGGAIGRVQSALSDALVAGGWYVPESRPFLAHVTVARVSRDARVRAVELPAPPETAVRCSRVTLYRSRLGPGGARYSAIASVDLGSAPGAADPVSVVRRFYDAQARVYSSAAGMDSSAAGVDSMRDLLTGDVVWHVPGASAIAGSHRGIEAVLEYFDTRRQMTDSTFRVTVHGVAMIADRVVQLAGGHAVRDGRVVSWETVGVFRVADGRIAECWLVPFDQAAFDEIWS